MNRLLNCDCLAGMMELPGNIIDLTVTSPPYDDIRTYTPLPMTKFEKVAEELLRITKPGGIVIWVIGEQIKEGAQTGTSSEQRIFFRDIGFALHDRLIMAKSGSRTPSIKDRYGLPFEEAFVLSKDEPTTVNLWKDKLNKSPGRRANIRRRHSDGSLSEKRRTCIVGKWGRRQNVWRYAGGLHTAQEAWIRQAAHGALMPEKMAEDLILSYSRPNDLVFDCFSGLATTSKMALLNHRKYLGMEVDAEYYELARKRMRLAHLTYSTRLATLVTVK